MKCTFQMYQLAVQRQRKSFLELTDRRCYLNSSTLRRKEYVFVIPLSQYSACTLSICTVYAVQYRQHLTCIKSALKLSQ